MDYDKTEIPSSYVKGRQLPEGMLELWMDAVSKRVRDPGGSVLDFGCGVGRFSATLGETFGSRVVGIDPSYKMLARLHPGSFRHVRQGECALAAGPK